MRRALCMLLVLASTAGAAESDSRALEFLQNGVARYRAGDYAVALDLFTAAQAVAPGRPNLYRWIGLTQARLGRCRDAVVNFDAFLRLAAAGDTRIAAVAEERDRCQRELPQSGLIVDSQPTGSDVWIDSVAGPRAGTTPYRNDSLAPGHHRVFVSRGGFITATADVELFPGETARAALRLQALQVADKGSVVPVAEASSATPSKRRSRWWVWTLVGVVLVGAGGAAAAGLVAASSSPAPPFNPISVN